MAADDPGRTMVATPRPSPPPQRAAREEDEPEDTTEHTEAEAEEEADAEAEVEEEMEAEAEAEAEVEAEGEDDGVRPRRTAMVAVLRATPALPAPPFFATEAVWCVRVCDVRRSAEVSRRLAIVEVSTPGLRLRGKPCLLAPCRRTTRRWAPYLGHLLAN